MLGSLFCEDILMRGADIYFDRNPIAPVIEFQGAAYFANHDVTTVPHPPGVVGDC
jgi:hypothetical protein